eukprot:TRINITY_DN8559_c0_g1_i2.p1 TRINITY_DN8559_c0_g1~~TRINITY_DN8559_c0_g1_i2.p1  ORF type:complete len:109 (+),score=35.28 TRINITY_DN8559_c0_g1_i2:39-365(+)
MLQQLKILQYSLQLMENQDGMGHSSSSGTHMKGDLDSGNVHDHKNMAYMGSAVISGRGVGVVVGIGERTQLGKISVMLKDLEDRKTPLQVKMEELGRQLSMFAFGIVR